MSRPAPKPPDISGVLNVLQRDISSLRQEMRFLQEQQRRMILDLQRAMPQVAKLS